MTKFKPGDKAIVIGNTGLGVYVFDPATKDPMRRFEYLEEVTIIRDRIGRTAGFVWCENGKGMHELVPSADLRMPIAQEFSLAMAIYDSVSSNCQRTLRAKFPGIFVEKTYQIGQKFKYTDPINDKYIEVYMLCQVDHNMATLINLATGDRYDGPEKVVDQSAITEQELNVMMNGQRDRFKALGQAS